MKPMMMRRSVPNALNPNMMRPMRNMPQSLALLSNQQCALARRKFITSPTIANAYQNHNRVNNSSNSIRTNAINFGTTTHTKSTNSNKVPIEYLTNGGTIEGVWIFHRHGDRAPNRYLGHENFLEREREHWFSRIPETNTNTCTIHTNNNNTHIRGGKTTSAFEALSQFFPPDIHPSQNAGQFLDTSREPFGFLTYRGMDQMRDVGKRLRERYEKFGHRSTLSAISSNARHPMKINGHSDKYSFLDHWNVQAHSTNYLRTVMSAQCLLDGLISGKRSTNKSTTNTSIIHAGGGLSRYYRDVGKWEKLMHLDSSTLTTEEDMSHMSHTLHGGSILSQVKVQVRDKQLDKLNAFDRNPQMMNNLVKDVIATERFQQIDSAAKTLATKLSEYLPGLSGAPQAFGGTPSGINWIHASDHFVCRRAHSVPLLAFSEFEGTSGEREAEMELAEMAIPVTSHLAWRFREWYRCPKLLAAVAAPPLKEVLRHMIETVELDRGREGGRNEDQRPFVMYSCHDVTLLSLLYSIGADFLVSGEDCGGKRISEDGEEGAHLGMDGGLVGNGTMDGGNASWRWWPPYSSTIVFELVKIDGRWGVDGHVIRVVLNGNTVRLVPRLSIDDEAILDKQDLCSRQRFGEVVDEDGCEMLRLSDFSCMMNVLEQSGGIGVSRVEVDTLESGEIDLNIAGLRG